MDYKGTSNYDNLKNLSVVHGCKYNLITRRKIFSSIMDRYITQEYT